MQEALDTLETYAVDNGEGGGGAIAVGGDEVSDVMLIEVVAQASRTLRVRFRGTRRAGERHGVTKPQVSGLSRVRVSGSTSTWL